MKAKAYKIELLVVDCDDTPEEDIICIIEQVRYIYPNVLSIQSKEIDWDDDHPLNKRNTMKQTCEEMFD